MAAQHNRELKAELHGQYPELTPAEVSHRAKAEISDPETEYDTARQIKLRYELRSDNFFMGNSIRGMLLNAFGWWLVGQVAKVAGAGLIGVGGLLAAIGFRPARRSK